MLLNKKEDSEMNSVPGGLSRLAKVACFLAILAGLALPTNAQSQGGYSTWAISPFGGYQWGRLTGSLRLYPVTGNTGGTSGGQTFGDGVVAGLRVDQDFHSHFGLEEGFTW